MARALSFCLMVRGRLPEHHTTGRARAGLPGTVRGAAVLAALAFLVAVFPADSSLALNVFPNDKNTGVPKNWTPKQTYNGYTVRTRGAVLRDVRIYGDLRIEADDVTVHRVEVLGGKVNTNCRRNTVLLRVTVARRSGQSTSGHDPAIGPGGYRAARVKIDGLPEGFRVGGKSSGCERTVIRDSFVRVVAPDNCSDWHGDGVQGYDGPRVVVRNTTIDFQERRGCGGTAAFFYPYSQGNTSARIDGLLVKGGGYPFRLGMPATVTGLRIVEGSWGYGPIWVKCSAVTTWDAQIVKINKHFQPIETVRNQPCNTNGGN
jgi:hypothetical protein